MDESLIARFSEDHPCWTGALLERAGEDAGGLAALEEEGLLTSREGVYWLTDAGREVFSRVSAELFLYESPGAAPDDPGRSLLATELWLELERCNRQRGGLKRYLFHPRLPARPSLSRANTWTLDGAEVRWRYLDHPAVKDLLARPLPPLHERRPEPPDLIALQSWEELPSDAFVPDLVYITHYDFEQYLDFKGHPGDTMKIINADRFFFSAALGLEARLDTLGQFHRWLLEQRRLRIPGYLDVDTQEQDSVNWLVFLSEKQEEALEAQALLSALGSSLIAPANPMEVWALSLEALRLCPSRNEVIWDVLPQAALPVRLTLNA